MKGAGGSGLAQKFAAPRKGEQGVMRSVQDLEKSSIFKLFKLPRATPLPPAPDSKMALF